MLLYILKVCLPQAGAPPAFSPDFENPSFYHSCFVPHRGEQVDVQFARQIIRELRARRIYVDRKQVFATGISAGGGMAFTLAIEAPDLVTAVAPVVPVTFDVRSQLFYCTPDRKIGEASIIMVASTSDRLVSYGPLYFGQRFDSPGMEATRDQWLKTMGIKNEPTVTNIPSIVTDDSHFPHSGMEDSFIEQFDYPVGPKGQLFRFYKVIGGGRPNEFQYDPGSWDFLGKRNGDIDFAVEAWAFFQEAVKQTAARRKIK